LHLQELRERLYDSVDSHTLDPTSVLERQFCEIPQRRTNIRYRIELREHDSIQDLLAMTPHYWRASPEKKDRLTRLSYLSVGIDVHLRCYSVRPD
jgi:23S rRNA (guanine745-N1)-methyltransferase